VVTVVAIAVTPLVMEVVMALVMEVVVTNITVLMALVMEVDLVSAPTCQRRTIAFALKFAKMVTKVAPPPILAAIRRLFAPISLIHSLKARAHASRNVKCCNLMNKI
jgi:hypothetical protein